MESKEERSIEFNFREKRDKLIAKLFTKYPLLFRKWAHRSKFIEFSDTPWTPFDSDISSCRPALVTTAGVHLKSQEPFDMKDPSGDSTFREISADTRPEDLTITHNYYDHADADRGIGDCHHFHKPVQRYQPKGVTSASRLHGFTSRASDRFSRGNFPSKTNSTYSFKISETNEFTRDH